MGAAFRCDRFAGYTVRMPKLVLMFFALTLYTFAQLNSADLRAKFGAPIERETFRVPQGFDLVVDYGSGMTVCQLQVPSQMPSDEKVRNLVTLNQRMYDFLTGLIPETMRGKELRRAVMISGINELLMINYENMTIAEPRRTGEQFGTGTITVRFKDPGCGPAR